MVYQIRIKLQSGIDHDKVFEEIQNGGHFYDNCVIEHGNPPVIVVEGHDRGQVEYLFKFFKENMLTKDDDRWNEKNISEIVMESKHDNDTILDSRREETGCLMVRTIELYEILIDKIISLEGIAPLLMGLDGYLDELISEKLKK